MIHEPLTPIPVAIRWPVGYAKSRKWSYRHWTIDITKTLCSVPIPHTHGLAQTGIYIPEDAITCTKCARMAKLVVERLGKSIKVLDPYPERPARPAPAWKRTGTK